MASAPPPWPDRSSLVKWTGDDAGGMSQDLSNQADWLAADGYLAVAPDLFSGRRGLACVTAVIRYVRARSGRSFDDIEAARAWLVARNESTGMTGVIGYDAASAEDARRRIIAFFDAHLESGTTPRSHG